MAIELRPLDGSAEQHRRDAILAIPYGPNDAAQFLDVDLEGGLEHLVDRDEVLLFRAHETTPPFRSRVRPSKRAQMGQREVGAVVRLTPVKDLVAADFHCH